MAPHVTRKSPPPLTPPLPPDVDTAEEPRKDAEQGLSTASKTATQGSSAQECPGGNVDPSRRENQTRPSAQLVEFLHSPLMQDTYTGVVATIAGQAGAGQRAEKMKKYLDGWTKGWEAMTATKKDK